MQQPSNPRFQKKYKVDEFAQYYAQKHRSSVWRRMSTWLERAMAGRSLARIRRVQPFQSVLDCPSGTGRFLPILARSDLSVIAMDASENMVREGRSYHASFRNAPAVVAGSAMELPLSNDSVDVVLCARLLHHISDADVRLKILREFARVARVGVVITFFDATSYHNWKRQRKALRRSLPGGRHAITRTQCIAEAAAAGLIPIGMNALFRFHTEITAAAFMVIPSAKP